MQDISASLAERIRSMRQPVRPDTAVPLARLEERYTRYGRDNSVIEGQPAEIAARGLDMGGGISVRFADYLSRLHIAPLRSGTELEFVQLALTGVGSAMIAVHHESADGSACVSMDMFQADERRAFQSSPICLAELPPDGNLCLQITTRLGEGASLSDLRWEGRTRPVLKPQGIKLVLIRTFGNRDVVVANLTHLNRYLAETGETLNDYLFVVYDATGNSSSPLAPAFPRLNIFELEGGNFGGGGNASLLLALLKSADAQLPEHAIREVVIWDDDACLEPEAFLRHRGFVHFRSERVAHTAMVMNKRSPGVVQEYGGIWGQFFAAGTQQLDIEGGAQRRGFPYLVRHGRQLARDVHLLSSEQLIEFGTFIFLSVPMVLLRDVEGPLPFFLRNDDVDFSLRLKEASGQLLANQNILAWHTASYGFSGEFFASLHGWIVNSRYFELSASEMLADMLERIHAVHSVANLPLLCAYRLALELFGQGPEWFDPGRVFTRYQLAMATLRDTSEYLAQIPEEVFDALDSREQLEIHDLFDGRSRRRDVSKRVVFVNKSDARYYMLKFPAERLEEELRSATRLCGDIASDFERIRAAWSGALSSFDLSEFWHRYTAEHGSPMQAISTTRSAVAVIDQGVSAWAVSAKAREVEWAESEEASGQNRSELPADFDPDLYLRLNPDVRSAGIDAADHYLRQGVHENRKYR